MVKCVGYKVSSGVFTPTDGSGNAIPYDNLLVYYVSDDDSSIAGQFAGYEKIKRQGLQLIGVNNYDELVGKNIRFYTSPITKRISAVEVIK